MEFKPDSGINTHVIIFPLPMQGPVNSMLKLAQLLILSSDNNELHVTFLTTEVVYRNLPHRDRHPRLSFRTFSDNLPENHPRGGDKFVEMVDAVEVVSHAILKDMLSLEIEGKPPVTCIVSDGLYNFPLDVGNQAGIPVFYFETMSPSCLWVYFCLPQLIQSREIPFTENKDLNTLVNVPGMEDYLRWRDLPHFCRALDETDHDMVQRALKLVNQFQRCQGIILNTFQDFDSSFLSYMRSHCEAPIYTIGPLHLSLKETMNSACHSNSLLQEDKSCIAWLNKQPSKSVIYCSFGSQVVISKDQLMEFWHGLVDSGISFLWVKRPGSVIGMDQDFESIPGDLIEGIKKRGCIVSWAPQVDILSHPAVGGFLTHSGWNSTMESVVEGVPMLCWPHYVDQLVISRLVTQVWKIGVDMKDTCNRATIANMVKEIMVLRRKELLANANEFSKLARKSVHEGGSSYSSMQNLISDMKSHYTFPIKN